MDTARLTKAILEEAPIHIIEHMALVLTTIAIAVFIAVPAGVILTRVGYKKFANPALNMLNVFLTIPAFAFIAAAMPILGIGYKPAIVVLTLQSLLPIARNTIVGLLEVDEGLKEAAKGMGMPVRKILFEIELPLAAPVILNGIRTATVFVVSAATLAGFIGAGGLGVLISKGLNLFLKEYIIIGATLGALLAIILDRILGYIENKYTRLACR
ncbi:MAG: ABC transporter permease subunit [Peptoclostridium sp.]|uniref:ABC transporter permease n=1 Tax=Peptoclostridium sp. TaxID=1904860 RepID=UPI00139BCDAA|nr:ABC transporter permease [Peptoclostridium sp.]MZQ75073.1 ABC transporter permease subunit [Peptoclostridium sp.]